MAFTKIKYSFRETSVCFTNTPLRIVIIYFFSVCVEFIVTLGSYYNQQNTSNPIKYMPVQSKKRVCFLYDNVQPVHCAESGCPLQPLTVSARTTRSRLIEALIDGWVDPVPLGGLNQSASRIDRYKLEVHNVDVDTSNITVQV